MTKQYYEFECGCKIPQFGTELKECDGLPSLSIDFYNINHNCKKTWELLGSGHTKGVFQLETDLGQSWSKKMEPWNLEDMCALISIIRPGILRSVVDGKSMTQRYIDRRNGEEPADPLHPLLEPILDKTYQILTYQEQAMRIATDVAGFNLEEADYLRKAIGKKDSKLMAEIKKWFLDKCREKGDVDEESAINIFKLIEESQKYSFNLSHGIEYGEIGYWTAYVKAHFPFHFFASWLYWAKEKQDPQQETRELVQDAKIFNVDIFPPKIEKVLDGDPGELSISKDGICFGIHDIKKIGKNHVVKLLNFVKKTEREIGKPIKSWSWYEFLIIFSDNISKSVINGLISVGALSIYMKSRQEMLFEYSIWNVLSDREKKWIKENYKNFSSLKESLENYLLVERCDGGPSNKNRRKKVEDQIKVLESPPLEIKKDDPSWIVSQEKDLLGISLSLSKVETTINGSKNTVSCKDFMNGFGKPNQNIVLGVEITQVKDYKIKNGQNAGQVMSFLTVADETCSIRSVLAFSGIREKYKDLLYEGNIVYLYGKRSNKKDSFVIDKIEEIE